MSSVQGELEWRAVQSNVNGNRGRWAASCNGTLADGTKCKHFRWGSPKSPTPSPNVPQQLFAPPPPPEPSSCATDSCMVTRVHPKCQTKMCRRHCVAAGGCTAKGHKCTAGDASLPPVSVVPPVPIDPILLAKDESNKESSNVFDIPIDPILLSVSVPDNVLSSDSSAGSLSASADSGSSVTTTPSTSTSSLYNPRKGKEKASVSAAVDSTSIPMHASPKGKGKARAVEPDAYSNPRHPSQMPPVFVRAYAEQEEERSRIRDQEALQRELIQRAKNTVTVFGWAVDNEVPTIGEFQDGFVLPQFKVSSKVLCDLGLHAGEDGVAAIKYYNTHHHHWMRILQGHVITLEANQLFLKNDAVVETVDFDHYCGSITTVGAPHLRNNLRMERTTVRQANNRSFLPLVAAATHRPINRTLLSPTVSSDNSPSESDSPAVIRKRKPSNLARRHRLRRLRTTTAGSSTSPHLPQHLPQPSSSRRSPDIISIHSDSEPEPGPSRHVKKELVKDEPISDVSLSDSDISDTQPSSPGLRADHPIDVDTYEERPMWPRSYYAVEIDAGFRACQLAKESKQNIRHAFTQTFGDEVPYCPTTISEHRLRWIAAGPSARSRYVAAGRTPAGQWTAFMAEFPAPGAAAKAAKKKAARQRLAGLRA